jgi:cytidylate kinase
MTAKHLVDRAELSRLVEAQMRNWELAARVQRAALQKAPGSEEDKPVMDFVAISRWVGAGGYEVAGLLGEKLGWPVFDKQILRAMAGDDQVRARLYESMDERDEGWLEGVMRWLTQGEFRRDDYFHRLGETVLALARKGPVIILGRGADLILPQECGLRVRIVAPHEQRVTTYAGRNRLDEKDAEAEMERVARERADFVRNHFGRDPTDPLRFDLILNLGRITADQAVELILCALRQRGVATQVR